MDEPKQERMASDLLPQDPTWKCLERAQREDARLALLARH